MIHRTHRIAHQDLVEFIMSEDKEYLLTDACKSRILNQFLIRFRQEFETELEFEEILIATIEKYNIQH